MTLQLCWFATEGSQEPLQTRKPVPHFKCSASFFGQAEQGSYPCSYSFAPSGLSLRSAYRGLYPRLCSSAPSGLFPAFCLPGFTPGCVLPPLRGFFRRSAYRGLPPAVLFRPFGAFRPYSLQIYGAHIFLAVLLAQPRGGWPTQRSQGFWQLHTRNACRHLHYPSGILHYPSCILHYSTLFYTILHS